MLGFLVGGLFPGFLERYETSLAADHIALCRRFVEHLTEWQLAAIGPRTVTHGDFRLDNMLFRGSDPSPYVVDWQTAVWGLAAYDVAYFVGGCLSEDDRRAHEPRVARALLQRPRGLRGAATIPTSSSSTITGAAPSPAS